MRRMAYTCRRFAPQLMPGVRAHIERCPVKRIFIPTSKGSDWQRLLAKPKLHWKKGASAMTTAAAWEDARDALPAEITTVLDSSRDEDLLGLTLLAAIPEWEVRLEGGDTASHTDVLAICRNDRGLCIIAVESKVDEDFGPLLKDKRAEASSGQGMRLNFLHSLLGVSRLDDLIRYQLVHRTASALLTAREFHAQVAVMLVHSFGTKASLRSDFDAFCGVLGAQELSLGVHIAPSFRNPRLFLVWCSGNRQFLDVELPSAL